MSNSVIDLTDSPPLSTEQANAFAPHTRPDTVVVSSDDERSPAFSGVTPLPAGYVLPRIHRIDSHDHGRPERITTLRDILSTRNSRQRGRSMLARQRAGLHFQPGLTPGTLVPHVLPHTGDEPVEAGVYYPIRARAMLPNQRQRQQQQRMGNALPASSVGRTAADGSVDVEDVEEEDDDEGSVISDTSIIDDAELDDIIEGDDVSDYASEEEDVGGAQMRPDETAGQTIMDYLMMRREGQRMMTGFAPHGAHSGAVRHARGRRPTYVFPFHPGMMPQHVRGNHITPFDFFPGEDISNILSFLEATTPAPPARPMAPLQPLKLSKRQEELALQPEYSRKVPAANFRDETELPTADSLEIVCTHCSSSLFDKEPVWAPACGHTMCNSCVDAITGASRACTACKKRVVKKSLVRLYL
ncbi:hypothetical protein IWW56_001261 [Coemansia sp. RSA 2131]|nr:hypothetical protein IWW56_001261 [Coemansia sp. RSA 2131]